ncbi:MAG TPA: hypothetical protein VJQ55_03935 [Candidatus Binatia bacterium]|nr:hypothetical protein [Candidatus Binatia bacterium]
MGNGDSVDLRRWAMEAGAQADNPRKSGDERDRLLKMRDALLDLAKTDEWLHGKPGKTNDPKLSDR